MKHSIYFVLVILVLNNYTSDNRSNYCTVKQAKTRIAKYTDVFSTLLSKKYSISFFT